MNLFLSADGWVVILVAILMVAIFGVMIAAIIVRIVKVSRKKTSNGSIDYEQKEIFENAYGGKSNIISVHNELSRLIVEVKDVENVNGQMLKDLGATGVLITGNIVKASFQERAKNIYELIK
ncbi:MAG: PTS transporter subunit EIIB [Bacilli bacterium]|jgi:glucose-like phosphotransferase system IIB component